MFGQGVIKAVVGGTIGCARAGGDVVDAEYNIGRSCHNLAAMSPDVLTRRHNNAALEARELRHVQWSNFSSNMVCSSRRSSTVSSGGSERLVSMGVEP